MSTLQEERQALLGDLESGTMSPKPLEDEEDEEMTGLISHPEKNGRTHTFVLDAPDDLSTESGSSSGQRHHAPRAIDGYPDQNTVAGPSRNATADEEFESDEGSEFDSDATC